MKESNIGAQITKYRTAAGLSQTQLSKMIGTSCNMISYWESGRHQPNRRSVKRLCEALNVTEACLYGIAGEWRVVGGRVVCPYCGKGQLHTKREIEQFGYRLEQIRFCIFCGREVRT